MLFHSPFGQDLLCSPSQLFSFFKVSASCGQYPFNPAMLLHFSGLHGSLWLQANCLADSTRFQLVDNNFPSSSKSRLFTCSLLVTIYSYKVNNTSNTAWLKQMKPATLMAHWKPKCSSQMPLMNGPMVPPKLYMLPKILERTAYVDELSGIPFALAVLIISGIIGTKQNPPDKPFIGSTVYTNQILLQMNSNGKK